MKNKHTIKLSDIMITILTEESCEYVNEVVEIVNNQIKDIITNGNHVSKIEAALFCALDNCSEKVKTQRKLISAEAQIALYLATINRLQAENDELRANLKINERKSSDKDKEN